MAHRWLLGAATVVLPGCAPEKPARPVDDRPVLKVAFRFEHGLDLFDRDASYPDASGHAVRFTSLRFLASGLMAKDADGQVLGSYPRQALEGNAIDGAGTYAVGALHALGVRRLCFNLGLDSALNHADPLTAPWPLSSPGAHWDWNPASGYKFLEMEGHVDGNGDGDFSDPEDAAVTYHCATDALLRADSAQVEPAISGNTATIALRVDVEVLLHALDLLAEPVSMGAAPGCALAMDRLVLAVGAP